MIIFPNAKINLGLHVLEKRMDGYHNIETCFYPVNWCDALEIIENEKYAFECKGLKIEGNAEDNLCVKAYKLMQQKYSLPHVRMLLYKNIPMGAGLGGGSSDAAFTIRLLNDVFELNLTETEMKNMAFTLGSDCSFFICNTPCLAFGRGNELKDINLSLAGKFIVIVYPNIHISTSRAYAGVTPNKGNFSIEDILLKLPVYEWKDKLVNDFEKNIITTYPVLSEIKKKLYAHGAVYASMSGSGSAMYGIFETKPELSIISFPSDWKVHLSQLK